MHKVGSFIAQGNYALAAVGVALLVLELWIVAEGVMVRLPVTTPVARVVEIAVALGARV